jgi:hypothetical protein
VSLLVLALVYLALGGPIGAARRVSHRYANGGRSFGWASAADGLLWTLLVILFFYAAWRFAPELQTLPGARGTPAAFTPV